MAVDHAEIIAALQAGESQKAVARRLGCSPSTVNAVSKKANVYPNGSPRRNPGVAAAEDYCLERRIALLNKIFAKAEQMAETVDKPHQLQALAIAVGILTDKRRLEDGEVTARTEVNGGDARERIASRLDELAARRRASGAA